MLTAFSIILSTYSFICFLQATGTATPCYLSGLLEKHAAENGDRPMSEEEEHTIKWSASGFYTGGADTVS